MNKRLIIAVLALTMLLILASCNGTHTHTLGESWESDETSHWQVCTDESCGEIDNKAEHTGGTATETEKAICEVCGQAYGELSIHEHNYSAVVTEPTCTTKGYTTYTCFCGDSYVADETEATEHSYNAVVTDPTCTTKGYTTYTCACGDSYVADETEVTEHSYNAVVTAPTCTTKGYTTYTCSCGDSYVGDETEVTSHNYNSVVTAPTCTAAGFTTYTCTCGDSYTADEVNALNHNMVAKSDDNYHWTECDRAGCDEATAKVAHSAVSISASYNNSSAMEHDVVSASDLTVTATCECGKTYNVTEGVTLSNNTLLLGANTVTVTYGAVSTTVSIEAVKFNKVINGTVVDDTYVYSGSGYKDRTYADAEELSANGDGQFRVFFRYNFSAVLAHSQYATYKNEAKVQFTFTMTTGTIDDSTKLTFKAYPVNETLSSVDFNTLCWTNYDATYGLGWAKADGFVNKEAGSPYVSIVDGKIIITLTLREIEDYIDENGNALFVFAIWKSSTKVGSMENPTEANRPSVSVILNDEHQHAYIESVVDAKYLASANCEETAKYFKSCSCGQAGTVTFDHGEVIEHVYGTWTQTQAPTCTAEGSQERICTLCNTKKETESIAKIPHSYTPVVTEPTCTVAGYTTYTCVCSDSYVADQVAALGHSYGEWLYDESYHWQQCHCGDVANKATHEGGKATETEQAVCDTCKQPYGGLASHVHNYSSDVTAPTCTTAGFTTYTCSCGDVYVANQTSATGHTFGEWESAYPATCEKDEVLVHTCACGESETGVGQKAFGHDMQTKYDENNHWTACAHNCGNSTDPVAHFGGEATETEQATCEGCGQKYGELKPAEKKEYSIAGSIVEDTYVASDSGTAKKTDYSTSKNALGIGSKYYRAYFKFNISNALNSGDFNANDPDAKIQFVFTLTKGSLDSTTEFTLGFFTPGAGVSDVAFSDIIWNNLSPSTGTALYPNLKWDKATNLLNGVANSEHVEIDGSTVTITFNYSQIADYVDANGNIVLTLRTSTTGVSIASMENTTYAIPEIKYVYYK